MRAGFLLRRWLSSCYVLTCQKGQDCSLRFLYKGSNFIREDSTLITKSPPNTVILREFDVLHESCGDTDIQSITPGIYFFISHSQRVGFSILNLKPHRNKVGSLSCNHRVLHTTVLEAGKISGRKMNAFTLCVSLFLSEKTFCGYSILQFCFNPLP